MTKQGQTHAAGDLNLPPRQPQGPQVKQETNPSPIILSAPGINRRGIAGRGHHPLDQQRLVQEFVGHTIDVMWREEIGLDSEATRAERKEQDQKAGARNAKPAVRGAQQGEAGGGKSGQQPDRAGTCSRRAAITPRRNATTSGTSGRRNPSISGHEWAPCVLNTVPGLPSLTFPPTLPSAQRMIGMNWRQCILTQNTIIDYRGNLYLSGFDFEARTH